MRVLIYTAICGSYDDLKQPVVQDIPCDFVCFTDTPSPSRRGAWRIIQFEANPEIHPRMQAKFFKILSHKVVRRGRLAFKYNPFRWLTPFKGRYRFTIWVDGSLAIKNRTFARDMISFVRDSGWAIFAHPYRDCIFEEAIFCAQMEKYRNLPIHDQVMFYKSVGIQPHSGLFACGVIVRREPLRQRRKEPQVRSVGDASGASAPDCIKHLFKKPGTTGSPFFGCGSAHAPGFENPRIRLSFMLAAIDPSTLKANIQRKSCHLTPTGRHGYV